MKQVILEPSWGAQIIEDTESGELSLQCICGGIGMYYRRIVLDSEEAGQLRAGTLDLDALVYEICHETPGVVDRFVSTIDEKLPKAPLKNPGTP
jgi:hypothetical protein